MGKETVQLFWFTKFLVSFFYFTIPKTSAKTYFFTEPESEYILSKVCTEEQPTSSDFCPSFV